MAIGGAVAVQRWAQRATRTVRRAVARPGAVWAVIFVAYLGARLVLIAGGTVFESVDSAVYAPRDDPARNHGPLVSLTGDAPRPWGLPAFYALFGNDAGRTVGQWALATLAWATFAWEASRNLRTRVAQLATVAALLGFSLLGEVASWDLAILTESLSISLGLLVLALLLRWLRTGSRTALAAMAVLALWWTFVRADIRVFTVLLAGLLAALAGRSWWRGRAAGRTGRAGPAAVAAVVLLGGVAWYAAVTPRMERAFEPYDQTALRPDPLPPDEAARVFRLRVDVSTNPRLWEAFRTELGMPTCPELEALRAQPRWLEREWAAAYTRCPELVTWVRARTDENFWTGLALADPGLFLRTFGSQVSLVLGGEHYAHVPQVVPTAAERAVFPSRRHGLASAFAFVGVALVLAIWAGARRQGGPTSRLFWTGVGLAGGAVLSAVATVAVHTGELGRYGVQEAYATRVATILLLGAALDAWRSRRLGLVPAATKARHRPARARNGADPDAVSSTAAARPRRAPEAA